jgi:hypothetical protein
MGSVEEWWWFLEVVGRSDEGLCCCCCRWREEVNVDVDAVLVVVMLIGGRSDRKWWRQQREDILLVSGLCLWGFPLLEFGSGGLEEELTTARRSSCSSLWSEAFQDGCNPEVIYFLYNTRAG